MNIVNMDAFIGFLIGMICIIAYGGYLFPRQLKQCLENKDWLSRLRLLILLVLLLALITLIPGVAYSSLVAFGSSSDLLLSIARITGRISALANVVIIVLMFNYKRSDDE